MLLVLKTGDKFIHKLRNGEGLMYEVVEDMVNPLKLVRTVSKEEMIKHEGANDHE